MKRHGNRRRRKTDEKPAWHVLRTDEDRAAEDLANKLEMSLAVTSLSVRTVNCLEGVGILTIGQLIEQKKDRLLEINNFGEQTLSECSEMLVDLGVGAPDWS